MISRLHAILIENIRHGHESTQPIHKQETEQRNGADEENTGHRLIGIGEREIPHATPMIDVGEREDDDEELDAEFAHALVVLERLELFVLDVEDERERERY